MLLLITSAFLLLLQCGAAPQMTWDLWVCGGGSLGARVAHIWAKKHATLPRPKIAVETLSEARWDELKREEQCIEPVLRDNRFTRLDGAVTNVLISIPAVPDSKRPYVEEVKEAANWWNDGGGGGLLLISSTGVYEGLQSPLPVTEKTQPALSSAKSKM